MTSELQAEHRPLPRPDHTSAVFWAGCADGRLLYQHCGTCGADQFYPRPICLACGATPGWATSGGRGRVYSFTIVRQQHAAPFRELVPYVVAMIELDEGVRLMGNVVDCEPESVAVGMPVEVFFAPVEDDLALPFWRPARPTPTD